jgi:hypothetical protein
MTPNQILWARSRDNLVTAVNNLVFPSELADLLARDLGSPKAIDRMASYVRQAKPRSEEMLIDEMLAIKAEIDAWRERKEAMEAQASYSARLFYGKPLDDE